MKAVCIKRFGSAAEMQFREFPLPQPQEDEVRIKIAYTSVNPVDWKIREGLLQKVLPYAFPIILGWDASGTIDEVGSQVKNFKKGDAVFAFCRKPIVQWGTYAEYVCMTAEAVAHKPKILTFAQAAALPLVSLTAWQALFNYAKIKKGANVWISAGAGGVGSIAIQLAKYAQAAVMTTCSAANAEYVKSLGANAVVDYTKGKLEKRAQEFAPQGLDCVFDCAGGETLQVAYGCVKEGGHIVTIVEPIDKERTKARGIHGASLIVKPNGEELDKLGKLFDAGILKLPHITEMPLDSAVEALEKNKAGHTRGKVVLRVQTP